MSQGHDRHGLAGLSEGRAVVVGAFKCFFLTLHV